MCRSGLSTDGDDTSGGQFTLTCADFEAQGGSLSCVVGSNGSGKSTFLRIVGGRLRGYTGEVQLNGCPLTSLGAKELSEIVAWIDVASSEHLVDELLVADYVALVLLHLGLRVPVFHRRIRAKDIAASGDDRFGLMEVLGEHLHTRVGSLSSGLKQKVVLALALLSQKGILLVDEGTSHQNAGDVRSRTLRCFPDGSRLPTESAACLAI